MCTNMGTMLQRGDGLWFIQPDATSSIHVLGDVDQKLRVQVETLLDRFGEDFRRAGHELRVSITYSPFLLPAVPLRAKKYDHETNRWREVGKPPTSVGPLSGLVTSLDGYRERDSTLDSPSTWSNSTRSSGLAATEDEAELIVRYEQVRSIKVLTWNLAFNAFDIKRRMYSILDIIREEKPHLIALQEVVHSSLEILLEDSYVRETYYVSDSTGASFHSYGTLLLSQFEPRSVELQEFYSSMGRSLVWMKLFIGGACVLFGTSHFESKDNAEIRKAQINLSCELLRRDLSVESAFLVGDFNSPSEEEDIFVNADFLDAWKVLRPLDPGFTRDPLRNPSVFKGVSGRLDKILYMMNPAKVRRVRFSLSSLFEMSAHQIIRAMQQPHVLPLSRTMLARHRNMSPISCTGNHEALWNTSPGHLFSLSPNSVLRNEHEHGIMLTPPLTPTSCAAGSTGRLSGGSGGSHGSPVEANIGSLWMTKCIGKGSLSGRRYLERPLFAHSYVIQNSPTYPDSSPSSDSSATDSEHAPVSLRPLLSTAPPSSIQSFPLISCPPDMNTLPENSSSMVDDDDIVDTLNYRRYLGIRVPRDAEDQRGKGRPPLATSLRPDRTAHASDSVECQCKVFASNDKNSKEPSLEQSRVSSPWEPVEIRLLGTDAIPGSESIWPSDHFGLLARFHFNR